MNIRNSLLLACLLQASFTICPAKAPVTIPDEIAHQMKKGKKLDLVWAAPDFDNTKGFRLGIIANETEDSIKAVQDHLPNELRRMLQADSPYTLQISVTSLRVKAPNRERSSVRLELEGRLVDTTGKMTAAFTGSSSSSADLDVNDSVRFTVRAIVSAMANELFPKALPKVPVKSSAVIVPAAPIPAHAPAGSTAATPSPATPATPSPATPATPSPATPATPSPAEPSLPAAPASVPEQPAQVPTVGAPTVPPSPSKPAAAEVPPEPPSSLVPTATAAKMKRGKALSKVWINPDFDRASGFALGEVRYQVEARNDGVDQYLPEALAEICRADSPYTLQIRIIELQSRIQGEAGSFARLGLEGNVVAKDGSLMAAFTTLESVAGTLDLTETFRKASRKVVLAIAKELN